MKYFNNVDNLLFFKDPQAFNKYTDKNILKYAIGANMYMPGTQSNIFEKLIHNKFQDIGAITLCCEDAIAETEVEDAENNIIQILDDLYLKCIDDNELLNTLPLIFIRVRNTEQFKHITSKMSKEELRMLTGFNFPKFNSLNGNVYFSILKDLSKQYNEVLYGMPIIEDSNVIYRETRIGELKAIQDTLNKYSNLVLNVRVGGTDFSSLFGLRRDMENSIYDLRVVADCLSDIINVFTRNENYVVSGPVWEYFSWDENSKEIEGLKKELKLDIQNGFQGKTIIHPSQINVVNREYIVNYSEYQDAYKIINSEGGVFKGEDGNRMNETAPHTNWAKKILARACIFGVYDKNARL